MPEPIRIPVVVDIDPATGALRSLRQTAQTEAAAVAAAFGGPMGSRIGGPLAEATRQTHGFREALQGARPAIAGVTQAVAIMGSQGSPAIAGLSRSLVGLASSSNMLGVAIGLAVGALAAFVSMGTEVEDAMEGARETTARLREELAALALEERAVRGGRDVQEQATLEDIEVARLRVMNLRKHVADDLLAISITERHLTGETQIQTYRQLAVDRERLIVDREQLREYEKQLASLESKAATQERILAMTESELDAWRMAEAAIEQNVPRPIEEPAGPPGTKERIAWQEQLRRWQEEADLWLAEQLIERNAPRPFEEQPPPGSGGFEERLRLLREQVEEQRKLWEQYQEFGRRTDVMGIPAQRAGEAFGAAVTLGLERAFLDAAERQDWRVFLVEFSDALSDATVSGILRGFLQAAGVQEASEQLGAQLFRLGGSIVASIAGSGGEGSELLDTTGGGADAPGLTEGIGRVGKSAPASEIIVVAIVPDEPAADAVVAKASARGLRAVAAKMNGQAVASGTIPSRRRR